MIVILLTIDGKGGTYFSMTGRAAASTRHCAGEPSAGYLSRRLRRRLLTAPAEMVCRQDSYSARAFSIRRKCRASVSRRSPASWAVAPRAVPMCRPWRTKPSSCHSGHNLSRGPPLVKAATGEIVDAGKNAGAAVCYMRSPIGRCRSSGRQLTIMLCDCVAHCVLRLETKEPHFLANGETGDEPLYSSALNWRRRACLLIRKPYDCREINRRAS